VRRKEKRMKRKLGKEEVHQCPNSQGVDFWL
jgi:hypothetical protein